LVRNVVYIGIVEWMLEMSFLHVWEADIFVLVGRVLFKRCRDAVSEGLVLVASARLVPLGSGDATICLPM